MASVAYWEDGLFDDLDIDDADIRKCSDMDTLQEWHDTIEATCEDIKAQIEGCALGRCADANWVYRASKAMGIQRRAQSRIGARMTALGWAPPTYRVRIAELNRKIEEAKARHTVAVEFLRLCQEGGLKDRDLFQKIEAEAVALVRARDDKRLAREAA